MTQLMKSPLTWIVVLLAALGLIYGRSVMTASKVVKKAIVVVSFGTTYAETRKTTIEAVEDRIRASFSGYSVRRAFTSRQVIKVLAERDHVYVDTLEQALDKLQQEGYGEVIVQPTHLTPGEEYDKKIVVVVNEYRTKFTKLTLGRPVLTFGGQNGTPDDYAIAVQAINTQLPMPESYDVVVFMGHGSPNQPNPAYNALQSRYDQAQLPVVIGVVEETDHPNFEDMAIRLKERNAKRILLMPLMLVAGDHANNDMAGVGDEAWRNRLTKLGYQVDVYVQGLGANPAFQNIYVQHVQDAISGVYRE